MAVIPHPADILGPLLDLGDGRRVVSLTFEMHRRQPKPTAPLRPHAPDTDIRFRLMVAAAPPECVAFPLPRPIESEALDPGLRAVVSESIQDWLDQLAWATGMEIDFLRSTAIMLEPPADGRDRSFDLETVGDDLRGLLRTSPEEAWAAGPFVLHFDVSGPSAADPSALSMMSLNHWRAEISDYTTPAPGPKDVMRAWLLQHRKILTVVSGARFTVTIPQPSAHERALAAGRRQALVDGVTPAPGGHCC